MGHSPGFLAGKAHASGAAAPEGAKWPPELTDEALHALASACMASYKGVTYRTAPKSGVLAGARGRVGAAWRRARTAFGAKTTAPAPERTFDELRAAIQTELDKWVTPYAWGKASHLELLRLQGSGDTEGRVGGFFALFPECTVIALRGTVLSNEWVSNLSYPVPSVRSRRQLVGLFVASVTGPVGRAAQRSARFRRVFDLHSLGVTAGYARHLEGVVAQLKEHLFRHVVGGEREQLPLWLTGHSLGGAGAIITRLRLLNTSDERFKGFRERMGGRIITVTFGAPPVLAEARTLEPGEPPICNILRPSDVVPSLAVDLLGLEWVAPSGVAAAVWRTSLVNMPATPYHLGRHFLLKHSGTRHPVTLTPVTVDDAWRHAAMRSASFAVAKGVARLSPFGALIEGHGMRQYAKELECLARPQSCGLWKEVGGAPKGALSG